MIDKKWLYEHGGRPVIYQSDEEFDLLHEKHKYKHKIYDPIQGIDYTWEREWRIHTDELTLEPEQTTLIVPNRKYVEEFKDKHISGLKTKGMILGDFAKYMMRKLEWHFIALEDLGVPIEWGEIKPQ